MFDIGMLVTTKGRIEPDPRRIVDVDERHARLESLVPGEEPMSAPLGDLRRYRAKTSDAAWVDGEPVAVLRILNPRDVGKVYRYEVAFGSGAKETIPETRLRVGIGELAPDPIDQLAQLDAAPWKLVSARQCLVESFFRATARSMGLAGYTGARMLPIPHQLNAARYAILFGRVRFLLADEVGLGKTVEAGLIVSTLRKYFPQWRAAVFVPESLTAQWAFEMFGKFGKTIFSLRLDEYDEDDPGIILPHGQAAACMEQHGAPEILVVDEAHRALADPEVAQALMAMSRGARAVLLLTATPRADDAGNLRKLLRLADPERFDALRSDEELTALLDKQGDVEALVQALREREPDVEKLRGLWSALGFEDAEIEKLIDQQERVASGRGPDLHDLRHAAALVTDRFYPGARVLRYQRKFLARDNAMAIRVVSATPYAASPEEKEVLDLVRSWLEMVRDAGHAATAEWQTIAAALIQSAHSSPLAAADWLSARRGELEEREGVTVDAIRLARKPLARLPRLDGEDALLDGFAKAIETWSRASRPDTLKAMPLSTLPRYKALVAELKEVFAEAEESGDAPHVLVFTGFESNAKPLHQLLRREFAGSAEVFSICADQPWNERERSAFAFQECSSASILVSDELGGEGRNFQFVTTLVHFDLPLAPWLVEQRIGRCDRVGRDEALDVDSRALVARGRMDEAVFEFLDEGVNVFNESIAPVESELDDVSRLMIQACLEQGSGGPIELIDEVAERLDAARAAEERDLLARSRVGVEEARRVADEANDAEELAELRKHVVRCARIFDSMVDERRNNSVAITVGEHHSLRGRPGVLPEMIGYFSRREAVRHERLDFFSPGHPFSRNLALAALEESVDRAAFVAREGLEKPCFLFLMRMQVDQDFFEAVARLPTDLQPPLYCRSSEAFGTTFLRVAADFDGNLLDPDDPANALCFAPWQPSDKSLHDGPEVVELLGEEWMIGLSAATDAVAERAERFAEERLLASRESFENLLCEVLSRATPTREWLEERVQEIMGMLAHLIVEFDSAVVLLPAPMTETE